MIHATEVIRRGHHFQARCPCGWVSKPHETEAEAERDAEGHVAQMSLANN
jgi:hypothetical protein